MGDINSGRKITEITYIYETVISLKLKVQKIKL